MWSSILDVTQIIFADIILSGDNALVIGMAASGAAQGQRGRVILFGMTLAVVMRIVFALIASYLLVIPGMLFFGGLLLAWVCWRFFKELRQSHAERQQPHDPLGKTKTKSIAGLMWTVAVADVSMSLDNVVVVAAIARDNTLLLVFGLGLSIIFMAFFATLLMRVMTRWPWISYLGLVFLVYLTGDMLYTGAQQLLPVVKAYLA